MHLLYNPQNHDHINIFMDAQKIFMNEFFISLMHTQLHCTSFLASSRSLTHISFIHFVSLKKISRICTFLHLFLLHKCTSHLSGLKRGSVKNENRYKRKENCRFINKIEQMENHFICFFFQSCHSK